MSQGGREACVSVGSFLWPPSQVRTDGTHSSTPSSGGRTPSGSSGKEPPPQLLAPAAPPSPQPCGRLSHEDSCPWESKPTDPQLQQPRAFSTNKATSWVLGLGAWGPLVATVSHLCAFSCPCGGSPPLEMLMQPRPCPSVKSSWHRCHTEGTGALPCGSRVCLQRPRSTFPAVFGDTYSPCILPC